MNLHDHKKVNQKRWEVGQCQPQDLTIESTNEGEALDQKQSKPGQRQDTALLVESIMLKFMNLTRKSGPTSPLYPKANRAVQEY